jgi:hypothetical protein
VELARPGASTAGSAAGRLWRRYLRQDYGGRRTMGRRVPAGRRSGAAARSHRTSGTAATP